MWPTLMELAVTPTSVLPLAALGTGAGAPGLGAGIPGVGAPAPAAEAARRDGGAAGLRPGAAPGTEPAAADPVAAPAAGVAAAPGWFGASPGPGAVSTVPVPAAGVPAAEAAGTPPAPRLLFAASRCKAAFCAADPPQAAVNSDKEKSATRRRGCMADNPPWVVPVATLIRPPGKDHGRYVLAVHRFGNKDELTRSWRNGNGWRPKSSTGCGRSSTVHRDLLRSTGCSRPSMFTDRHRCGTRCTDPVQPPDTLDRNEGGRAAGPCVRPPRGEWNHRTTGS